MVCIKRVFSCFVIAILLITLFLPLNISASNSEIFNINDAIFVRDTGGELYSYDFELGLNHELSSQETFMCILLEMGGSSYLDSSDYSDLVLIDKLDVWQSRVYNGYVNSNQMDMWEAVDVLFENYCYIFPDSVSIVFSESFIATLNYWVMIWNELNEDSVSISFSYVSSFDFVNWNDHTLVYSFYIDTLGMDNSDLTPDYCKLSSILDYENNVSKGFLDYWDIIFSSLDPGLYVSWLPDIFSSVFLQYWFLFLLPMFGALVLLKVLHG